MKRYACLTVLVLFAALIGAPARAAATEANPWWQAPSNVQPAELRTILGDDPGGWTVQNSRMQPVSPNVTNLHGQSVLMPDATGLRLTRTTFYPAGVEITVRYLFALSKKESAHFRLAVGIKDPTNAQEKTIWFSSSAQAGGEYVQGHASDPDMESNKVRAATAYFRLDGIGDRQLGWPEALRRIVENEAASLPSLDKTWMTVRVRLREHGYSIHVNDRLFVERQNIDIDPRGMVRLELSPKAALASFTVRPLPAIAPAYVPIRLDAYVNASQLNGAGLNRSDWPAPDSPVLVEGIPFLFPAPDGRGNDHIDLGFSWLQSCTLDGHMDPSRGPFHGRWPSPFVRNPARIQFQIPNRRYRAVHVIAAADGDANSVPVMTLQFYRVGAGAPVNVGGRVPLFAASSSQNGALPVKLDNGKKGNLYLVTIPIDPGILAKFDDQDTFAVELTKEVRPYRCYPDPSYYSSHAAGLPSSVRIFAMTFETPRVSLTLTPEAYAGVWTAPKQPSYTVALTNFTAAARMVTVEVATVSYDGLEKTLQSKPISLRANQGATIVFPLLLKRYGYHDVTVKLTEGEQVWNEPATLAYLHEDTRERGNWDTGKGTCYGAWCWGGGHGTPPADKELEILALAGGECQGGSFQNASETIKAIAQKYGMVTFKQFAAGDHYTTAALANNLTKTTEQAAVEMFLADLRKTETKPSPITSPRYISFYPEPHLGPITSGALPEYFGEPPYEFSKAEEDRFQFFVRGLLVGAPVVRQYWPNCKIMVPHGDPMFTALFLRKSPESRKWIDGLAVDIPVFERLPEQQIHQVSLHRLWMCLEESRQAGKTNMAMPMYEGPCLPSRPGALTEKEFADQMVRCALILNAYGIDQFPGAWGVFECSGYWGEQHYGGGLMNRMPHESPKPAYAAHATMTRLLNRSNFKGWLPTGSLSVYATRYQHYKTGADTYVLWTIRGKRPVTFTVPVGAKATVSDMMDNATELTATNGTITFTVESEPRMVQGLATNVEIVLGLPDHADSQPAAGAQRLSNLGAEWKLSAEPDPTYADNSFHQVRRFPGRMAIRAEAAPAAQGGKAIAVTLEKQAKERRIMPYYTTLVPRKPVEIPGKARYLGLWVRAASDWGRVIYSLRDAKGERWISVGTKDEWNCDDIHNWSVFCFDGWRYLRFELPANSPYDSYRELGTTWWGHFGKDDGIVDLPLRIEKVFVERRTHAMYVNDPQPARPDDVLLADLYAEYERPEDATAEAVRLSRLRMPVPAGVPDVENPIPDLEAAGVAPAIAIKNTTLPEQTADGTQCYVHFDPVEGAKGYQVWVSPYVGGQGALLLGKDWKAPGQLLRGLRPDTDFYLFLAYTDKDGKPSKPSKPYRVHLKDIFGMK